jgi:superfamily II DNA or RNA helicase
MRKGRTSVIIATQLADEGLDVPNLDCLILASGGRAAGRAIQRAGRIMRIADDKQKPIIFDLVDGGPFKSQWRSRATAYKDHLDVSAGAPVTPDQALYLLRS